MAAFADNAVSAMVNAVCPKRLRDLLKEPDQREASDDAQGVPPQPRSPDLRVKGAAGFVGSHGRTRSLPNVSDERARLPSGKPESAHFRVTESYAFQRSLPSAANSEMPVAVGASDTEPDVRSLKVRPPQARYLAEKAHADELRDELANYREEREKAKAESERLSREFEKLRATVKERAKEASVLKSSTRATGADAETSGTPPAHVPRQAKTAWEVPPAGLSTRDDRGHGEADSRPQEGPPWGQDWQEMCDSAMQPGAAPTESAQTGDADGTRWGALKAPALSWDLEREMLEREFGLGGVQAEGWTVNEAKPIRDAWEGRVPKDINPEPEAPYTKGATDGPVWSKDADNQRWALLPSFKEPLDSGRPKLEPESDFGEGGRDFLNGEQIFGLATSRDTRQTKPGARKLDGERGKTPMPTGPGGYMDLIMKEKEKCEKYMNQSKRLDEELHRKMAFCAEQLAKPAEDDDNKGGSALGLPTKNVPEQFKWVRKVSYRHTGATFPGNVSVP